MESTTKRQVLLKAIYKKLEQDDLRAYDEAKQNIRINGTV